MKSLIFIALFVVIQGAFGAVIKAEPDVDDLELTEDVTSCLQAAIDAASEANPDLADVFEDVSTTLTGLASRYQYCQSLAVNDPPTNWENIAVQACMTAWQANVLFEINRLRNAIIDRREDPSGILGQLAGDIAACRA